jgi:hypothetical protein
MDVPVATAAPAPTPTPLPAEPQPAPAPISIGASSSGTAASTPTHGIAAPGTSAGGSNQQADQTVSPVVAKLFNASAQNVVVSFQVSHSGDVVTVFTDKSTGKEIIQFPSQEMIAFGEMLDKDAGKVLDKSV